MPAELKTKYHVVALPDGTVSHEHEVVIDSPQGALSFTYESTVQPTDWLIVGQVTPAALRREADKAQLIEAQARATEAQLRPLRERIQFVLKQTTGFDSVDNPQLWLKQYADYYGWGAPTRRKRSGSTPGTMKCTIPFRLRRHHCRNSNPAKKASHRRRSTPEVAGAGRADFPPARRAGAGAGRADWQPVHRRSFAASALRRARR